MTGNASPLAATMADVPSLTGRAREAGLVRSPAPTVEDLVALALAQLDLSLCREAFHGALAAAASPAGLATALAERLKGEADRHWLIDLHASLRLADATIALGELATEPRIVALGTMARADALRLLGDPRAALVLLDTAADLFQRCGDQVGWARTRISQMPALMLLGLLDDALAVAARARPVLLAHNEVLRVARLDFNTAYAYEQLGRTAAALERYAIVAASCQDLGTPEAADLLVMTRVNQAIVLTRQGRLSEALASLREARFLAGARPCTWPRRISTSGLSPSSRAAMVRPCAPCRMPARPSSGWLCRLRLSRSAAIFWTVTWLSAAPTVCWLWPLL